MLRSAEIAAFFISPFSKSFILLMIAETRRLSGWVRYVRFSVGADLINNPMVRQTFFYILALIFKYLSLLFLRFDIYFNPALLILNFNILSSF